MPAPEREGVGRDGRKGRTGAGPKEGGGKDGEQKRRRKGAREGRPKEKIDGKEGVPRVWAFYWGQSGRSLTGPSVRLAQPHSLPQGWLPDQGQVKVGASLEATPGLVEKEGTQSLQASGSITVGWARSAATDQSAPAPVRPPTPAPRRPSPGP